MNLTKKITAILLVLAMLFAFSSCMGIEEDETGELDIGTINIGIIYNGDMEEEGTLANKHFAAFQTAFDLAGAGGSQINQRDGVTPGDAEAMDKTMNDLLSRGCRLIITTDAGYYDGALKFAKENPSVFFVAMTEYGSSTQEMSNFATFDIRTFETEYLEGMMAAASSANGKIGYVAATENATEVNAFANGAKSINPNTTISLVVTDDVKAGIDKITAAGCDTVYSMNYEVDEEGNRFFNVPESVKYDMCVNTLGDNGKFISASCLNLDRLYTEIITDTVNEKFEDLKLFSAGVKEGVVDVRPAEDAALQAKVNAEKDKLFAGTSNINKLVSTSIVLYTLVK